MLLVPGPLYIRFIFLFYITHSKLVSTICMRTADPKASFNANIKLPGRAYGMGHANVMNERYKGLGDHND